MCPKKLRDKSVGFTELLGSIFKGYGSLKNVGPRNFRPDLEISEAFVTGLEVLFSDTFASWSIEFF